MASKGVMNSTAYMTPISIVTKITDAKRFRMRVWAAKRGVVVTTVETADANMGIATRTSASLYACTAVMDNRASISLL